MSTKGDIKDLKNLGDIIDFSNPDNNLELFSNKNKKVIGKFKLEAPKIVWIAEIVCLRREMYSNVEMIVKKLRGISKSHAIIEI